MFHIPCFKCGQTAHLNAWPKSQEEILCAKCETPPALTREQLITLVRYADSHLEDWRTGVEDGTYDDKEGLEELVAAIAAGYAAIGKD